MDNDERAREWLRDELRDHDAHRCSCYFSPSDPDKEFCTAVLWRDRLVSSEEIIEMARVSLEASDAHNI